MDVVASTRAILAPLVSDSYAVIGYVLGAVLTVAIVLLGVGFGWRQIQKRITGRKI